MNQKKKNEDLKNLEEVKRKLQIKNQKKEDIISNLKNDNQELIYNNNYLEKELKDKKIKVKK